MTKRVLITGGSRGIGAATAVLAGARGWRVAINYHSNAEAADETAEAVRSAGGEAALAPGDVADHSAVVSMFDAAQNAFGELDAVVINAGVVAPLSTLADADPDRIRRVIDVNVTGALLTAREAARRIEDGGSITILSSVAARIGSPNEFIDYAASKGAMDTLTRGLATELGPRRIRVNAVRPGLIETEIHADAGWANRAHELAAKMPLGRAGTAEEVGEAIVWLISDAASYVSGAILDVAGAR